MKKIMSLVLSVLMVMCMVTTAFAAEGDTYTITITNEVGTHTYEAYQIFAGDLHEDVLSNITWGSGVTEAGQATLGDAAEKAASLTTTAQAEAFAKEVAPYLTETPNGTSTVTGSNGSFTYTISDLEPGYYLVKDKDDSQFTDGSAYTEYILKVVKDVNVAAKDSSVVVEKKVDDKNDSNTAEDEIQWHDSADHDIGDKIDFQITTKLPSDFTEYETYTLTLHDEQSAGLTFLPETVVVKIGEEVVANTQYSVVTEGLEDGCTFEIRFANVRAIEAATNNSVITVTYKSELNSNAIIGSVGNPNTVYGEYSNSFYDESIGRTPDDTVIVFTYKLDVDKVTENAEGNMEALQGAGFTLYKYDADAEGEDKWVQIGDELVGGEMTNFVWNGLDDGNYKLVETTTPAGYNTIDPIFFTVTAEHDILSDNPALTKLEVNQTDADKESGSIASFTADTSAGSASTDVVNESGTVLPETGGIGTTIFYIVGGILVVAAVVLLVTRKRMDRE